VQTTRAPVKAASVRAAPAKAPPPVPIIVAKPRLATVEKSGASRRRLKFALMSLAALSTLLLAGATYRSASDASPKAATPEAPHSRTTTPYARFIGAPGLVEASSGLLNLSFELPGKLKVVLVDEGQSVKAGQLIAELENADLEAKLQGACAELNMAETAQKILEQDIVAEIARSTQEVERLKAEAAKMDAGPRAEEIARAQAEVHIAEADAKRMSEEAERFADEQGLKSGAWTVADRDSRRHQADAARGKLDLAAAQLQELKSGYRAEDRATAKAVLASAAADLTRLEATREMRLDVAKNRVLQARSQANISEAELRKSKLFSPINGRVVWKFMRTGESIDALRRQPIVAVADCSQLRVRAYIDEADFPRIMPGQNVKIRAEAYDDQLFDGMVERVGASAGEKPFSTGEAKERNDVKVIETIVKLGPNCPLKLGLRVTASFELK
jgi:HlyD family secretion protein